MFPYPIAADSMNVYWTDETSADTPHVDAKPDLGREMTDRIDPRQHAAQRCGIANIRLYQTGGQLRYDAMVNVLAERIEHQHVMASTQ